jgi:hypothetical protein
LTLGKFLDTGTIRLGGILMPLGSLGQVAPVKEGIGIEKLPKLRGRPARATEAKDAINASDFIASSWNRKSDDRRGGISDCTNASKLAVEVENRMNKRLTGA